MPRRVVVATEPSPLGPIAIWRWIGACGAWHRYDPTVLLCGACLDAEFAFVLAHATAMVRPPERG